MSPQKSNITSVQEKAGQAVLAKMLHAAVVAGDLEECKALFQHGAPLDGGPVRGLDPMLPAAETGREDICAWLLENGATFKVHT